MGNSSEATLSLKLYGFRDAYQSSFYDLPTDQDRLYEKDDESRVFRKFVKA